MWLGNNATDYSLSDFEPAAPGMVHVPHPNHYRDEYNSATPSETAIRCAQAIEDAILMHDAKTVAAVIGEPVSQPIGAPVPAPEYWPMVREICDKYGVLLIVDEVITGFRLTYGGAQNLYDVYPDITCLGKIIGGGLPVGAYGASSDLMQYVSPLGSMYQAGTLSGNPIAVTAGLATLNILKDQNIYNDLEVKSDRLSKSITEEGNSLGINIQVNRVGSLMTIFFSQGSVDSWDDVINADQERYTDFFIELLRGGVYIAPSPFEAMFVSAAHSMIDIDKTISVIRSALSNM